MIILVKNNSFDDLIKGKDVYREENEDQEAFFHDSKGIKPEYYLASRNRSLPVPAIISATIISVQK